MDEFAECYFLLGAEHGFVPCGLAAVGEVLVDGDLVPRCRYHYEEQSHYLRQLELVTLVGGAVIKAHSRAFCERPRRCPLHAPSNHHMKTWRQLWRSDRGIIERVCEHGIGHPDPDDGKVVSGEDSGVHGCDGCCAL